MYVPYLLLPYLASNYYCYSNPGSSVCKDVALPRCFRTNKDIFVIVSCPLTFPSYIIIVVSALTLYLKSNIFIPCLRYFSIFNHHYNAAVFRSFSGNHTRYGKLSSPPETVRLLPASGFPALLLTPVVIIQKTSLLVPYR